MDLLKNLAVIGGVGVGTFVAAPVVGGAALGLLGFKAGGIAAGSIAASMMSSSAVASGGGILTGGKSSLFVLFVYFYGSLTLSQTSPGFYLSASQVF